MAAPAVVATGMCKCSFGMMPTSFMSLADKMISAEDKPIGNIMDNKVGVNIIPFGMCTSPANPMVAAAMGAPMPCQPLTPSPWMNGSLTVMIKGQPALTMNSMLMCNKGMGVIQFVNPGAQKTIV